jgi:hypothetical protein
MVEKKPIAPADTLKTDVRVLKNAFVLSGAYKNHAPRT